MNKRKQQLSRISDNINKSLSKIKNLIYVTDHNLFGVPKVNLEDYGFNQNDELEMILIEIEITTFADSTLHELVDSLQLIEFKLRDSLSKISFDRDGNLTSSKRGGLIDSGVGLISNIKYDIGTDELKLTLGYMFGG